MNPAERNHPCGEEEQAGDESGQKKSSLVEKKSRLGMNLARRNHLCGEKEQAGDENER